MNEDAKGAMVPGVATEYTMSDDGLTYTFKLRPEAKWSNGEPVTAANFVDGWRRAVDPATAPAWVFDRLDAATGCEAVPERDPCILPKAQKTGAELAGTRVAHLRAGVAFAEFLAWLALTAPEGGLT